MSESLQYINAILEYLMHTHNQTRLNYFFNQGGKSRIWPTYLSISIKR